MREIRWFETFSSQGSPQTRIRQGGCPGAQVGEDHGLWAGACVVCRRGRRGGRADAEVERSFPATRAIEVGAPLDDGEGVAGRDAVQLQGVTAEEVLAAVRGTPWAGAGDAQVNDRFLD